MTRKVYNSKQYKSRKKRKILILISAIVLIFAGIFLYFNKFVNPMILQANVSVIRSKTNQTINSAIITSLQGANVYDDLINITYDNSGNITSISANSLKANVINNKIIADCQKQLDDMQSMYFEVKLGSFSGIPLLNGIGPDLKIRMIPVGNVQSVFVSNITSCGINQTHHQIYLNYKVSVSVLLPGANQEVIVNSQVLIGESIIVGEVPQVYFGSNSSLNTQLNLVP